MNSLLAGGRTVSGSHRLLADNAGRIDPDAITNRRSSVNDDVVTDGAVSADAGAGLDHDKLADCRAVADGGIRCDYAV
jgi:hypothetical protein